MIHVLQIFSVMTYLHGGIIDWSKSGLEMSRLAFIECDILERMSKLRSL